MQGRTGFLVGLACFAAAHSVYAAAFGLYGTRGMVLGVTAAVAALFAGIVWLSFRNRIPASMRLPVVAYLAIVATMPAMGTAAGISHRAVPLFSGVLLVAGSDIAVANERFGKPLFANKLPGLPFYYAGQSLIALSLTGS